MIIAFVVLSLLVTYLVGSIPTGYLAGKWLKGIDLRTVGSGSTGATNVYRNIGKRAGITVFFLDFLKGYAPVVVVIEVLRNCSNFPHIGYLSGKAVDSNSIFPVLIALAALIGHSRSIFLKFQGGKSAATGLGTLFALDFRVGLFTFIAWMLILYIGKIVSIASILATAICIPLMIFFKPIPSYIGYCVLGFIYVTIRHKANIGRIISGTEPKIGGKSK